MLYLNNMTIYLLYMLFLVHFAEDSCEDCIVLVTEDINLLYFYIYRTYSDNFRKRKSLL